MPKFTHVVCLILVLVWFGFKVGAQEALKPPVERDLDISIFESKACYVNNEKIRFVVRFTNKSSSPIYLYKKKGSETVRGLKFSIYDSGGELAGSRDPIAFVPPPLPTIDDFERIDVGMFIDEKFSIVPQQLGVSKPGFYTAIAIYQSPIYENRVPPKLRGMHVRSFQESQVFSKEIVLRFAPDC